jgi:hypothetical protein
VSIRRTHAGRRNQLNRSREQTGFWRSANVPHGNIFRELLVSFRLKRIGDVPQDRIVVAPSRRPMEFVGYSLTAGFKRPWTRLIQFSLDSFPISPGQMQPLQFMVTTRKNSANVRPL